VPLLDAVLGVAHADDPLRAYLREMRDYMPPGHRAFLAAVERGCSAHDAVAQVGGDHPTLVEALDCCLRWLEEFRSIHLEYAARYIHRQSQSSEANPTAVGTGGTPFMPYLAKHRDETTRRRTHAR
jgi:indoleamine 2,3-dioxygenase